MKLSKAQREVLQKMADGWEIGACNGCWLQRGGVGRGGETARLSVSTLHVLRTRGLVAGERSFPTTKYNITEAGKAALEEK